MKSYLHLHQLIERYKVFIDHIYFYDLPYKFNNLSSVLCIHSHLGSLESEGNTLNLVHHGRGFIKNLKSPEYQTGIQNGNIQGSNIVSTQKIGEGKYEAENQINLLPGFESNPKDKFSAEIKAQNPQYQWQYALSDHLGNIRVLFTDKNNNGLIKQDADNEINEVLSVRNYSPFGLELGGSHKNLDYQNVYKFNGKEVDNFSSYLDYGGRWLDQSKTIWGQIDPLGESTTDFNLFHFSNNNPINFFDGDGLSANRISTVIVNETTGERTNINDGYDFVFKVSNDEYKTIKNNTNGSTLPFGDLDATTNLRWIGEATSYQMGKTMNNLGSLGKVYGFFGMDEAKEISYGLGHLDFKSAGLALFLAKVQKAKSGYKLIEKLFKYGKNGKLPTPTSNPLDFKPGSIAGEKIHKATGAIFQKSKTSHGNPGNVGEQWKIWPEGTKSFGKTSKTSGNRVTIDGNGNVIGN